MGAVRAAVSTCYPPPVADAAARCRPTVQDRAALVNAVAEAYAYQIFVSGFFNADPHAGNILVTRDWERTGKVRPRPSVRDHGAADRRHPSPQCTPVLLDFGLTKRLSPTLRLGFARLGVAVHQLDYAMILDAFGDLGFRRKDGGENSAEDLKGAKRRAPFVQREAREILPRQRPCSGGMVAA